MIVYNWPPRGGVGMSRPLKFAKYLGEFGWEPTVLTPSDGPSQIRCPEDDGLLQGVRVVKTGYTDVVNRVRDFTRLPKRGPSLRRDHARTASSSAGGARGWLREMLSIPDEHVGWYRHAVREGTRVALEERFDCLYSSSPPETSHLIARALKDRLGIPWVADVRDPWSGYHHTRAPRLKALLQKRLDRRTLSKVNAMITVSWSFASAFERIYGKRVRVITNGFDGEDFAGAPQTPQSPHEKFTLLYTGKIHRRYQNPEPLFAALKELIEEGKAQQKRVQVHFNTFGQNQPDFDAMKKAYGLDSVVQVFGPVGYRECMRKLMDADVLLLVDWDGEDEISRGVVPAKVFDYMGARRPILVITGRGESDLSRIVSETGCGTLCRDKDGIKAALERYYREFIQRGGTRWDGADERMAHFTRRALTSKLAEVLNEASRKS
jgi:glycosyltransferase involved in cell wall biosynthesis